MKNKPTNNQVWKMCKCKKFGGYSIGYICLMCKKHIYTKEQGGEVDQLREKQKDWEFDFKNRFLPIHAHYGNPPEDITEPILDFIRELLASQRKEPVKWCEDNKVAVTYKADNGHGWAVPMGPLRDFLDKI